MIVFLIEREREREKKIEGVFLTKRETKKFQKRKSSFFDSLLRSLEREC
jgi:hypothetical protein